MSDLVSSADQRSTGTQLAAAEFHVIVAALFVQSACADRIRQGYIPPVTNTGREVDVLLTTCGALLDDNDDQARSALTALTDFTQPDSLRERRIALNTHQIGRSLHAMQRATTNGNTAAAETLLRRALDQLTAPLLPAH